MGRGEETDFRSRGRERKIDLKIEPEDRRGREGGVRGETGEEEINKVR